MAATQCQQITPKTQKQTDIASDLSEPVHSAPPAISLTEKLGAIIVRLYIYLVKNICMQATFAQKLPWTCLNVVNERVCYFNNCSGSAVLHFGKEVHFVKVFIPALFCVFKRGLREACSHQTLTLNFGNTNPNAPQALAEGEHKSARIYSNYSDSAISPLCLFCAPWASHHANPELHFHPCCSWRLAQIWAAFSRKTCITWSSWKFC